MISCINKYIVFKKLLVYLRSKSFTESIFFPLKNFNLWQRVPNSRSHGVITRLRLQSSLYFLVFPSSYSCTSPFLKNKYKIRILRVQRGCYGSNVCVPPKSMLGLSSQRWVSFQEINGTFRKYSCKTAQRKTQYQIKNTQMSGESYDSLINGSSHVS